MPIDSRPDHVAVAVPALEDAATRWHDELGAGYLEPRVVTEAAGFATSQLHYVGGCKLELLEPTREDSFARAFLDRFGAGVHHITLVVPSLPEAIREVERAGFDVVDVAMDDELWHEGFLRPSQVGGVIVQLAASPYTSADWARHWNAKTGWVVEEPAADGAVLHGPTLGHPDLDAAHDLWTLLGAGVTRDGDALDIRWDDAPLSVRVERADVAGPIGLRFAGAPPLPGDPRIGPPVLPV